ncbi:histidine phosphatase family protein [Candidatus Uhrbacteria bacterium]|nr:histidine phosphatase family protein [Candidatus Uhrbacteria bacterium]
MTKLYIVRHGETEANRDGIIQGHIDRPLTEEGMKEVQKTAEKLWHIHFDAVYSSDLLRAQRTAEIILLERQLAVKTTAALRERNWGKFDGRPTQEFYKECAEALKIFEDLTHEEKMSFQFADVESHEKIAIRLNRFLREIAVTHDGQTILISTHGGIMRAFLIHLGWGTFENLPSGSVKNASYFVLNCDGVDFFVKEVHRIEKQENIS